MLRIFFILGVLFLGSQLDVQDPDDALIGQNSLTELLIQAKNTNLDIERRISLAERAVQLAEETRVDSTILTANKVLVDLYLYADVYDHFIPINHKIINLSTRLNDSVTTASALHNLAYYHVLENRIDSSYYYYNKVRPYYNALNEPRAEAQVLFYMADLQETASDFIGSEDNAIQAAKILMNLKLTDNDLSMLWELYNLLGLNALNLGDYEKSLDYHQEALNYSRKKQDGFIESIYSLNNIAVVYRENGEYDKALEYYNDLLSNKNLMERSPTAYALYLTNRAYCKFLSGDYKRDEILNEYWQSKQMSEELESALGLITVYNNLTEFYEAENNLDSTLFYAEKTLNYSRIESDNDMVLKSLATLAEIEEPKQANLYLQDYIKLNDSLLESERSNRNKVARIQFETDQIIAENEQISRERLIFLLSSIGLLVTLILLYIIISQRVKNKALEFRQVQQKANEEIYNLMLAQQDKEEEGRTKEKKRISEELHDGVLGRLFGIRLSLDSLNLQQTDEAAKTRSQYIDELKSIEQEIRKISHDLNSDFIGGSSFSDILQTLVKDQCDAYGLTYSYDEDDSIDWDELTNKTKIHIYRMLQESMQNVYKHANAKHIKISFQLKNNVILLTIEDDGSGFNVTKARKGIGLKNFDSRAKEIGGRVEIFSAQGEGTKIKIYAPTG